MGVPVGVFDPSTRAARITSIELRHIRGFSRLKLPLPAASGADLGMLTAIVGKNGTCKSTLLRCIALGLVSNQGDASTLLADAPGQLLRFDQSRASVRVAMASPEGEPLGATELTLESSGGRDYPAEFHRELQAPEDVEIVACGYGPGRNLPGSVPRKDRRYRAMDALMPLFNYGISLERPELLLRRLEDHLGSDRYDQAMRGLRRVLGLKGRQRIEVAKGVGGVIVTGPGMGDGIRLEGWADGYRMTITWLLDFYGWAIQADAIDDDGHIRGILLIDEAEQHLHPSMQADLLVGLRKAFPKVQIIATTHSPLTALGAGAGSLVALHNRGGYVKADPVPDLTAYSAEDVLSSPELFDTEPYPERTQKLLREYRGLLRKGPTKRTQKESERMRGLARALDAATLPEMGGGDLEERRAEMRKYLEAELGALG